MPPPPPGPVSRAATIMRSTWLLSLLLLWLVESKAEHCLASGLESAQPTREVGSSLASSVSPTPSRQRSTGATHPPTWLGSTPGSTQGKEGRVDDKRAPCTPARLSVLPPFLPWATAGSSQPGIGGSPGGT